MMKLALVSLQPPKEIGTYFRVGTHMVIGFPNEIFGPYKDLGIIYTNGICGFVSVIDFFRLIVKLDLHHVYSQLLSTSKLKKLKPFLEACSGLNMKLTVAEVHAGLNLILEIIEDKRFANTKHGGVTKTGENKYFLKMGSSYKLILEVVGVATAKRVVFCSECHFSETRDIVYVESNWLPKLVAGESLAEYCKCPNKECKGAETDCISITVPNPHGFIVYFDPGKPIKKGGFAHLPPGVPKTLTNNNIEYLPILSGASTHKTIGGHAATRMQAENTVCLFNCNKPRFYHNEHTARRAVLELNMVWYIPKSAFEPGTLAHFDTLITAFTMKDKYKEILKHDHFSRKGKEVEPVQPFTSDHLAKLFNLKPRKSVSLNNGMVSRPPRRSSTHTPRRSSLSGRRSTTLGSSFYSAQPKAGRLEDQQEEDEQ